ncbi:LPS assembly lipoprotein LptE [Granulicella sibirica]|uniref:Putative lipoprotein n=1 Tax=Granulicella sibirica TaxID=2479048 RepID=A0A4V1L5D2_9BACT|nr:LPS assembly lipoprotein LptE [Granulicella sibirica]RXH55354.1 putative lipoprotein [Granulicella sibirica]
MRLPQIKTLLLLPILLLLTSCGYHAAGSATHIPTSVHTLAVPIFTTHSQAYHTEVAFTQATIRELNTRTKYVIESKDAADADATLTGTILAQSVAPLTYDSTSGQTSSYLITVTARILLTARDGTVLYRNDSLAYREQYQSTQDLTLFVQEDSSAVRRIARDFSQALVSDMLESFK